VGCLKESVCFGGNGEECDIFNGGSDEGFLGNVWENGVSLECIFQLTMWKEDSSRGGIFGPVLTVLCIHLGILSNNANEGDA